MKTNELLTSIENAEIDADVMLVKAWSINHFDFGDAKPITGVRILKDSLALECEPEDATYTVKDVLSLLAIPAIKGKDVVTKTGYPEKKVTFDGIYITRNAVYLCINGKEESNGTD